MVVVLGGVGIREEVPVVSVEVPDIRLRITRFKPTLLQSLGCLEIASHRAVLIKLSSVE